MPLNPTLLTLAHYLAGEFDNREQAIASPVWFVHLRLWQRPVPLFTEDSLTLFAEQANVLQPEQPYRQRLLRLSQNNLQGALQVQYYAFKDPHTVRGAGAKPDILQSLTPDQIELLPGCVLNIEQPQSFVFVAAPLPETPCYFRYNGEVRQVSLGFEARPGELISYDKGIDPETGTAIWGALMGPYRFTKRQDYLP
ncbi:chromophore lyase CpcT/CpeT [Leptothermofonsia sichuanensis E412]|uniref:chromophore lyase CpcT/CpeT n=1 Tax=Leptothermofonsia sichuanensis TaxID=2917832 RepID=UPI001CA61F3F|nr:chromophore lyase CpcT/CpeT [Leptothermofonsia sichuanensis]QZZ21119.1 chromophore lyase CpcT/CpeT [Leptothermofonsia sichuanensis E412]